MISWKKKYLTCTGIFKGSRRKWLQREIGSINNQVVKKGFLLSWGNINLTLFRLSIKNWMKQKVKILNTRRLIQSMRKSMKKKWQISWVSGESYAEETRSKDKQAEGIGQHRKIMWRCSKEWTDTILYVLEFSKTLTFPIFLGLLFANANPHKYEANRKLPVVIASFVENTDFMWILEVQILKVGKSNTDWHSANVRVLYIKICGAKL